MKNNLSDLLFSWPFLLALSVLLINDGYLKAEYVNGLTGKLSDFSGIFLVSLLLFRLLPNYIKPLFIFICTAFLYWKSAYSEPLIQMINHYTPLTYGRVVDYTDLLALIMVPLAGSELLQKKIGINKPLQKLLKIPLILITSYAIMATSQVSPPRDQFELRAPESNKLKTEDIIRLIKTVAFNNELYCRSCELDKNTGSFYGDGITLDYWLEKNNHRIRFDVVGTHAGVLGLPDSTMEEMDVLQQSLKSSFNEKFGEMEFIVKPVGLPDY